MQRPDAILIAGPTASGKSKLALDLADRWDGEIINTDSMQVYPVLQVLTARPDDADLDQVPHHLYGTVPIDAAYSVTQWLAEAKQAAQDLWRRDKVPVFVGGTGLYFRAIEQGLANTPEIPPAIRSQIREDLISDGSEAMYQRLQLLDAEAAERLKPADGQRIARALEVVTATGKSLHTFQNQPVGSTLLAEKTCERMVIMPERSVLCERINVRTDLMIERGALEEVRELMALNLAPECTVLKAIGVRQLGKFLEGDQLLSKSVEEIKIATRQYAKRQSTWFRGQFDSSWQFRPSVSAFL